MPLILDIFGVVLVRGGLNEPLLQRCIQWRRDGEKIYGASNMSVSEHITVMQNPLIAAAFDMIYCSGQLGVSKPDPVFFAAVREKLGLLPEHLLFLDDSGINVDAAQRLGWNAAVYTDVADAAARIDGFFANQRRENDPDKIAPPVETDA